MFKPGSPIPNLNPSPAQTRSKTLWEENVGTDVLPLQDVLFARPGQQWEPQEEELARQLLDGRSLRSLSPAQREVLDQIYSKLF